MNANGKMGQEDEQQGDRSIEAESAANYAGRRDDADEAFVAMTDGRDGDPEQC